MTKEGAERLQRYLGRTWSAFIVAGAIGIGIGYEIKRNSSGPDSPPPPTNPDQKSQ